MPLEKGSSKKVISKNIGELMSTDKYPKKQAAAIAFSEAGKSKKKVASKKKKPVRSIQDLKDTYADKWGK